MSAWGRPRDWRWTPHDHREHPTKLWECDKCRRRVNHRTETVMQGAVTYRMCRYCCPCAEKKR